MGRGLKRGDFPSDVVAAWVGVEICMASAVPTAQAWPGLLLAAAITLCNGELPFSKQTELLCNFFTVYDRKISLAFSLESCAAPTWD